MISPHSSFDHHHHGDRKYSPTILSRRRSAQLRLASEAHCGSRSNSNWARIRHSHLASLLYLRAARLAAEQASCSAREMSFSSSMDDCAPVQFLPASATAAAATTFRSFAAMHAAESSPLHSRTPSPQEFAAAAHSNALASSSHRQCLYAPQPQQQFSNFSVPAPAASPPPFAIVAGWAHVAGNMFHCPQTRTFSFLTLRRYFLPFTCCICCVIFNFNQIIIFSITIMFICFGM